MALRLFGRHAQRSYERAMRLYNDGAWELAIAAFDTAITELHDASNPYSALARFYRASARGRLGARLLLEGRFRDAVPHLDAALTEQPGYPDLHFRKAAAHLRLGQLDAADASARAALRLNGQYAHARVLLALLERARGEEDAAREELQRAKQLAEHRGMPLAQRLEALPALPKPEQLWPLLFEDPRDAASTDAATALYAEGRYEESRQELTELLARMPDYADLRLKLAMVHYQLGELEPARRELCTALDLNPRFSDAWALLGAVHLRERAVGKARAAFETAGREGLRSPFVDYGRAVCSLLTGEAHACADLLRPLVSQPEAPLGASHLLACARALSGDLKGGLAQLVTLSERHDDAALRCDALSLALELRDAVAARALLHHPSMAAGNPLVRLARARLALAGEDLAAMEAALAALDDDAAGAAAPYDAALQLAAARLESSLQQPSAALRRLEALHDSHPGLRGTLLLQTSVLRALGRAPEAAGLLAARPLPPTADDDLDVMLELLFSARCVDDTEHATLLEERVLAAQPLALRARVQRTERWLLPVLPSHAPAEGEGVSGSGSHAPH